MDWTFESGDSTKTSSPPLSIPITICGDNHRFSPLESVGEAFAKLVLNQFTTWITFSLIPESSSEFRSGHG